MKKLLIFVLIAMVTLLVQQVYANGAGDVGSEECLTVQQEAQTAVQAGEPYKNHGHRVKEAAHATGSAVDAGFITEECASCIVSQFARKVVVEDQIPCGQVAEVVCPCWNESTIDAHVRELFVPFCFDEVAHGYPSTYLIQLDQQFLAQVGYDGGLGSLSCFYIDNESDPVIHVQEYPISEAELNKCREILIDSGMWAINECSP
jgi:hypothetical protein